MNEPIRPWNIAVASGPRRSDRLDGEQLIQTLARMGYMDYAVVTPDTTFTLNRPQVAADRRSATVVPGPWDGGYR